MSVNATEWNKPTSTQGSTISQPKADPLYSALFNEDPKVRKQISQALKNAGYRVKVSEAFSDSLYQVYSEANAAAMARARLLGKSVDPKDGAAVQQAFNDYIIQESTARLAEGGTGGAPKSRKEIRITDETTAAGLIQVVMNDLVDRGPTAAELKKYTSALQRAQESSPVVVDYSTSGSTTTGGLNEQQFLIDQIAGSDEAQANKVMGYYDVFKQAIGVQ